MRCNVSDDGRAAWDDLLQYGEGAMLEASQSAYDEAHGHLWLQTVFDVSAPAAAAEEEEPAEEDAAHDPQYAAFLKQYDVATAALLNLPLDVTNAAVLAAHGGMVWSVGGCNGTNGKNGMRRCLWSVDGTKDVPAFTRVMVFAAEWEDVMPGVSGMFDDGGGGGGGGMLHVVARRRSDDDASATTLGFGEKAPPPPPPLTCTKDGVCHRVGDGTTFEQDGWHVVALDLAQGTMTATPIAFGPGIDRTASPLCGVAGQNATTEKEEKKEKTEVQ